MKALANTTDMMTTTHFSGIIDKVEVLCENEEIRILDWKVDDEGLHVNTTMVSHDMPVVFKIVMD
jgi:hypothetical protein